jgi:hypothetical protein
MVSVAPLGAASRIAARILFNVPRAGSGMRARYSSTLPGVRVRFVALLLFADSLFIICAILQKVVLCVYFVRAQRVASFDLAFSRRDAVRLGRTPGAKSWHCSRKTSGGVILNASDQDAGRISSLPTTALANLECRALNAEILRRPSSGPLRMTTRFGWITR